MDKGTGGITSAVELLELAESENDEGMAREIERDAEKLEASVRKLEFKRMFRGEWIHTTFLEPAARWTEGQDWAQMCAHDLKWARTRVGQKSSLEAVKCRPEKRPSDHGESPPAGAHRTACTAWCEVAVRLRQSSHTSFASVFVSPEVDDDIKVDLNPADISMDVYRSSGAGGQHVNKTESAVRLTHGPSGIVVACQNERSQHKNRATAMKMLKAKMYELEVNKRNAAAKVLEDSKSDVSWGNQIRSYVLDQSRIKDLRTLVEVGNTTAVLDGDLDQFMEASLKAGL